KPPPPPLWKPPPPPPWKPPPPPCPPPVRAQALAPSAPKAIANDNKTICNLRIFPSCSEKRTTVYGLKQANQLAVARRAQNCAGCARIFGRAAGSYESSPPYHRCEIRGKWSYEWISKGASCHWCSARTFSTGSRPSANQPSTLFRSLSMPCCAIPLPAPAGQTYTNRLVNARGTFLPPGLRPRVFVIRVFFGLSARGDSRSQSPTAAVAVGRGISPNNHKTGPPGPALAPRSHPVQIRFGVEHSASPERSPGYIAAKLTLSAVRLCRRRQRPVALWPGSSQSPR